MLKIALNAIKKRWRISLGIVRNNFQATVLLSGGKKRQSTEDNKIVCQLLCEKKGENGKIFLYLLTYAKRYIVSINQKQKKLVTL